MSKVFYEGDLDFAEINKRLKKEKPEKLTKQNIVHNLKDGLNTAIKNGVSYISLINVLQKDYGISLTEATLKKYLNDEKKTNQPENS